MGVGWAGLDGRSFSGVSLPLEPLDGGISFEAMRATAWSEQEVGTNPTLRLLLDGDVKIQLGLFKLVAERAVVWMQKRPDEGGDGGEGGDAYQVFVYFDTVSTPGGASNVGVWAERLPLEGVLRPGVGGIRLKFAVRDEGRPTNAFVEEGERKSVV